METLAEACDSQASRLFHLHSLQGQFEITNKRSNCVNGCWQNILLRLNGINKRSNCAVNGCWLNVLLRLNSILHFTSGSSAKLFLIFVILFFRLLRVADARDLQGDAGIHGLLSVLDSASAKQAREQQDQHFQQAAFQAFDHHKTGEIYNVSSSGGSIVQAIRLRSGSFRKYGLVLNEFEISPGCQVESSSERVLLVYESLGKSNLFPLDGYVLVGPVVGISVYDASDLRTTQPVPKLTVTATRENISVHLRLFQPSAYVTPFCAYFDDNSVSVVVSNVTSTGMCYVSHLGFFSLVARSSAPAPAPAAFLSPLAPSINTPPSASKTTSHHGKSSRTWKIVVGSVVGCLALLVLLSTIGFTSLKYRRHQRLAMMEYRADLGETLHTALIRNTRAPAAGGTRTQPVLESEYVS